MTEILLSIIVPVRNESSQCVPLLKQLQRLRATACEVIVIDGGSDDDTITCARPYVDKLLSVEPGRALQMNAGAKQAKGQWLWFLHADTTLPEKFEGWLALLADQAESWGFFSVRLSGEALPFRVIERGINWRSCYTKVATGDQGIYIRRDAFETIGGFEEQPLMEDIAATKQLRKLSRPMIPPYILQASSRRWQQHGMVKTVLLMWWLRLAYFLGVSPRTLVKAYYRA
jgi:rSAM/selenodomain-associated transferase 2